MHDEPLLPPASLADPDCDIDASSLMLGLVAAAQFLALVTAVAAIAFGLGWLIALLLHLLVGTSALLGAALLVATAPLRNVPRLRRRRRVAEIPELCS